MKTQPNQSAEKVLAVLNLLMRHFAHGLTNAEIASSTGLGPSNVCRYVAALESAGFAERIPETGRYRPSHRIAQLAVGILKSLDDAQARLQESVSRITKQV